MPEEDDRDVEKRPPDVEHEPVLVAETLHFLEPRRGGLFVDCTVGAGGHAEAILESGANTRLLGLDRDPLALRLAAQRLERFGDRVRLVEARFSDLASIVEDAGLGPPVGLLADLGVSSMQLDRAERGFSFQREGPLDMRMGQGDLTAAEIVNEYPEETLERIFRDNGEETKARRIARAIVREREESPIESTGQLRQVVSRARGPERGPRRRIDPATRVFQALRIEVNRELEELRSLLEQSKKRMETDGRIVILSYHSLEDRIVKNVFRDADRGDRDPVTGRTLAESRVLEVLTRRPVRPSEEEVARNPRSRSARLRAARRL